MTKQISITNAETGETIVRDMTPEELTEFEFGAIAKAERIAKEEELKTKQNLIASKLGISKDELNILFGIENSNE